MGFQSVNEINTFAFRDCELISIERAGSGLRLEVEALIVEAANSQNTNYTDSYAGTTIITLENATIIKALEEGHRYYDANDRLLEEVPDRVMSEKETEELLKKCKPGCYLFGMVKEPETTDDLYVYSLGIDVTETDSYWIYVSFTKAIFRWDRYMNRVQS